MKYREGNLLDLAEQGEFDIIIQGCNCFCTMGSGIARRVKDRYPKAYLADQLTQKGDPEKLGKFTQAYIDFHGMLNGFTILNAYTQIGYIPRNKVNVDYCAVRNVFTQIKMLYDMNPQAPRKIGIPMIGAGLAGGDWSVIEAIIDDIGFSDITCVVFKE